METITNATIKLEEKLVALVEDFCSRYELGPEGIKFNYKPSYQSGNCGCDRSISFTIQSAEPKPLQPELKVTYETVDDAIREIINRVGWTASIPAGAKIKECTFVWREQ